MSDFTLKTYGDLDIIEGLSESSHVIIEENGDVKRYPVTSIGGASSWNDLEDKPFGETEDGIKTIDPKYLPEDIGGGASSWNDLEDKPFETTTELVEALNRDFWNRNDDLESNSYYYWHPSDEYYCGLKTNRLYHVFINDTEYICNSVKESEYDPEGYYSHNKYIGNKYMFRDDLYENTGEPFCIQFSDYGLTIYWETGLGETIQVRILEEKEIVTKLESKFVAGVTFDIKATSTFSEYGEESCTVDKTTDDIEDAFNSGSHIRLLLDDDEGQTLIPLNRVSYYTEEDDIKHVTSLNFFNGNAGGECIEINLNCYSEIDISINRQPANDGSWDNLTNKPFGDEYSDTLYWWGDTEGLESVGDINQALYRVYNDYMYYYSIIDCDGTVEYYENGEWKTEDVTFEADSNDIIRLTPNNTTLTTNNSLVIVCNDDCDDLYTKKGVYFAKYTNPESNEEVFRIEGLTINGYSSFRTINKIDPQYLPKASAVADVTTAPTAEDFNALLAALREAGYLAT